ncbi:hypothetical protein Tco_0067994, partial [Tanacetum coccineum]
LGPRYEVRESSAAAAAARPAGGLRADYGFVATMDREIRRDPERYVGYGITDSWDEIVETLQGAQAYDDYIDAGGRSQEAKAAHRGTEADKETSDSDGKVRETVGTHQRSCITRATGGGW